MTNHVENGGQRLAATFSYHPNYLLKHKDQQWPKCRNQQWYKAKEDFDQLSILFH